MKSQISPEITRAAERYLEEYGDPIVMNTYLKVTILILAGVSVVLAGLVYKSQRALADMHPMIVRRKPRTSITSRAGLSSISAAIASPSSAIRPTHSIS